MHGTMDPKVVDALQRQLNQELAAAHSYTQLGVWSDDQNLHGFRDWFYKQAGEERAHAQKFIDHLLDRNIQPALAALPAPQAQFPGLLEVAHHALHMEQDNTRGITACYEAAQAARDYLAQPLLLEFLKEQVEEEAWATEMVERVERATCAGGLGELDRHIERYLKDEK